MTEKSALLILKRLSFTQQLADLFSVSTLSKFDNDIFKFAESFLKKEVAKILKVQVSMICRARRLINIGNRGFVHIKYSKKILDSGDIPLFSEIKGKQKLCSMSAVCESGKTIDIVIETFNGILHRIEFYSKSGECYPKSNYYFEKAVIHFKSPSIDSSEL